MVDIDKVAAGIKKAADKYEQMEDFWNDHILPCPTQGGSPTEERRKFFRKVEDIANGAGKLMDMASNVVRDLDNKDDRN